MLVRCPTQFVLEVPQFREEFFLLFDFFGKSLRLLARLTRCGFLQQGSKLYL